MMDGIRLAGLSDIAAMKLAAVTGRGTKKDFVDLYFLLQHFTLQDMLGYYNEKYADGSEMMVLRSLTCFDDADQGHVNMITSVSWPNIKSRLQEEVRLYISNRSWASQLIFQSGAHIPGHPAQYWQRIFD